MRELGRIAGAGSDALAAWAALLDAHRGAIPAYPSATVIPLVVCPEPPGMDERPAEVGTPEWLMGAYIGAYRARYRKPCPTFGVKVPAPGKYADALDALGPALTEHRVPPGPWFWWLFGVWDERLAPTAGPTPGVRWVLKPENVPKWRGWFWGTERARGGQSRLVPAHAELLGRYSTMRAELLRVARLSPGEMPPARVARIVGRHFPEGLYESLTDDARAEQVTAQAALNQRALRGEYLW